MKMTSKRVIREARSHSKGEIPVPRSVTSGIVIILIIFALAAIAIWVLPLFAAKGK